MHHSIVDRDLVDREREIVVYPSPTSFTTSAATRDDDDAPRLRPPRAAAAFHYCSTVYDDAIDGVEQGAVVTCNTRHRLRLEPKVNKDEQWIPAAANAPASNAAAATTTIAAATATTATTASNASSRSR